MGNRSRTTDSALGKTRQSARLSDQTMAQTDPLHRGWQSRDRHQPRRERDPPLCIRAPQLAVRRYGQRRQGQRPSLQPSANRAGQRTGAVRVLTPSVHRAPRRADGRADRGVAALEHQTLTPGKGGEDRALTQESPAITTTKDVSPMSNPRISVSQLKQLIQLRSNNLSTRDIARALSLSQ